jgi:outer membrane protein
MIGALVIPISALRAATLKIGVVDLHACLRNSIAGKNLLRNLEKKKDAMQKQIRKKQKELLKIQENLQKQGMMLSNDAREKQQKTLERKQREYKYFVEDMQDTLRKEEAKGTKQILLQLQEVIGDIAAEDKYSLILEKRAGVVFNDVSLDITDKVITRFDKNQK